ncbi:MAG: MFS transporter, partial [Ilumatobacteraceae bacterium]
VAIREERQAVVGRLDAIGLVLTGGSIALVIYTMTIGPEQGWTAPRVMFTGTVGVVGLVAAVWFERRADEPALLLRLFQDRLFRTMNLASSSIYAGFFGLIFVLPVYLQSLRGFSALESGLASSPQAFGVLLVSNLFGKRAYRSIGPRRLMVWGTAAAATITGWFATFDLDTPLLVVGASSFARGLAIGLVFVSIQTGVYATTSMADTGRATSLFNTQRQVSYAVGTALAATVLAAGLAGLADTATAVERLSAHRAAFLAVGFVMVPGIVASWWLRDDDVAATRVAAVEAAGDRAVRSS